MTTAGAMLVVIMVMMLMVVVIVATALTVLIVVVVVMVMMVLMLLLKCLYSVFKGILMLHSSKYILTIKIIPGGCYNNRLGIVLAEKLYTLGNLLFSRTLGMRKNDSRSMLYLIVIKLTKVFHIHFTLVNIGNGGEAVENCTVFLGGFCRANNIRKLANTGGLNYNTVGGVLLKHLYKRLGKITN